MISLDDVLKATGGTLVADDAPPTRFQSVTASSKDDLIDGIFVAVRGVSFDGHQFITQAKEKGATLTVVENDAGVTKPYLLVSDSRVALSQLASLIADYPTKKLPIIGITGTNGKTTTHWMASHLLSRIERPTLRVGTIGISAPQFNDDSSLTTPDPVRLHKVFKRAVDEGCEFAVMEVSSHALDQSRVNDVLFDVAVFTNLSRDHLDYHQDMKSYAAAKAKLFSLLKSKGKGPRAAVVNSEGEWGAWIKEFTKEIPNRYCVGRNEAYEIQNFSQSVEGSSFTLATPNQKLEITSPFIGYYNAENLVLALLAVSACGVPLEKLIEITSTLPQVPGRLERCGRGHVYVDYAHTPDALQNVLLALRPITEKRLLVCFGCGGDRDRGKRSQMMKIASTFSDGVIVTSDNPRTEDPGRIIQEILEGAESAPLHVDVDREGAVQLALRELQEGDILLIAGKGHEDYQIIGTTKYPFSDKKIVQQFFQGITS